MSKEVGVRSNEGPLQGAPKIHQRYPKDTPKIPLFPLFCTFMVILCAIPLCAADTSNANPCSSAAPVPHWFRWFPAKKWRVRFEWGYASSAVSACVVFPPPRYVTFFACALSSALVLACRTVVVRCLVFWLILR